MNRDAKKSNESYLKIPHLQIVKPSVQRTQSRTRNSNKRAGSGGKKPKFRSEGGGEGIRVGEVGVRYERAVEISRFRRRPCGEIYIFGAKGGKSIEGRRRGRRGKVNESFLLLTPARRGQNPPRTRHPSLRKHQWEETFPPPGRITLPQCLACSAVRVRDLT